MALRLSTGFTLAMLGKKPTVADAEMVGEYDSDDDQLVIAAPGAPNDTFTHGVAATFDGFQVGQTFRFKSESGTNDGVYTINTKTGTVLTVDEDVVGAEAAAVIGNWCISAATGYNFWDLFKHGVIAIYSGTQPANADAAEDGTKLCEITPSGIVVDSDDGLLFTSPAVVNVLSKDATQSWQEGSILASNTAAWFRFYDSTFTTGASVTAVRFDGAIGLSGVELNLSNTALVSGASLTIDTFTVTLPQSS